MSFNNSFPSRKAIIWKNLQFESIEYASFFNNKNEITFENHVIFVHNQKPYHSFYKLVFDKNWVTKSADIKIQSGEYFNELKIKVTETKEWFLNGKKSGEFLGIEDIDLGISPLTNTMPIKRLNLNAGESKNINAVWVKFPELEVKILKQEYHFISENQYRYTNPDNGFTAKLLLDNDGFVEVYENIWKKVL